ncbi:hypothetical protein ACWGQ5_46345 [Streptomyces sp. NPDC055722]
MSQHRKPRTHSVLTQRAVRVGLLAAGAAGLATAVPAQAVTGTAHSAVALDRTYSRADVLHHKDMKQSMTVRQFGEVHTGTVRNQATALGVGCSVDDHCSSVAISWQIVFMAGEQVHLNAINRGDAINEYCDGCQTRAYAQQWVVSTPRPFALSQETKGRLADIHRRLDALTRSTLRATDLKARVDSLAAEVNAVLRDAVAKAPKGPEQPRVTLHRHLDGWPSH